jgi:hypothetical protein
MHHNSIARVKRTAVSASTMPSLSSPCVSVLATLLVLCTALALSESPDWTPESPPPYYTYMRDSKAFTQKTKPLFEKSKCFYPGFLTGPSTEVYAAQSQKNSAQDFYVLLYTNDKANGFYVDLAANMYKVTGGWGVRHNRTCRTWGGHGMRAWV